MASLALYGNTLLLGVAVVALSKTPTVAHLSMELKENLELPAVAQVVTHQVQLSQAVLGLLVLGTLVVRVLAPLGQPVEAVALGQWELPELVVAVVRLAVTVVMVSQTRLLAHL
jgi:hypothetical protein